MEKKIPLLFRHFSPENYHNNNNNNNAVYVKYIEETCFLIGWNRSLSTLFNGLIV